MLELDLFGELAPATAHGSILADSWDYPPFSVLSARDGWWQERKRKWLAMGIKSELGRGGTGDEARTFGQDLMRGEHVVGADKSKQRLTPGGGGAWLGGPRTAISDKFTAEPGLTWVGGKRSIDDLDEVSRKILEASSSGTSIFDPVICELAYKWFCPENGTVIDPFAGGSVRGVVASVLGRSYHGVELRAEQVAANRLQGAALCPAPAPVWHEGDSRNIGAICEDVSADFVFSCPPYADLEVYSDNPQDLSTLAYADFKSAYFEIIAKTCALLKPDSFACFVVGDVRDKKGNYYNFVGDTVEAFRAAGLHYYNEAILVTAVGSLPIRAGKQFKAGRKLGKTHQNILVFVKGDGKRAAARCNGND